MKKNTINQKSKWKTTTILRNYNKLEKEVKKKTENLEKGNKNYNKLEKLIKKEGFKNLEKKGATRN